MSLPGVSPARGAEPAVGPRDAVDQAGPAAPSSHRRRRVESIAAALEEVTSHLPAAEARRRRAAIVYLCSLPAWITVSEECELSAEDAREGIAWAIETLVGALRQENERYEPSAGASPRGGTS